MNTKKFENTYKMLNEQQRDAVDTMDGPVMVIAGPGTGKTQIIGARTANIILKA
jgi:DNA helicase-2/ATP-dependent DNA helicase PcrA